MEKRRRARINKCLGDLKNLLLEHLKRDPSQTSKLEKADILEMTVHLLRRMQQEQLMRASMIQPSVKDRFLDGWRDCAAQVNHYANTVDGMPGPLKEALQRHLADRYRTLQQSLPGPGTAPVIPAGTIPGMVPGGLPPMLPSTSRQRLPPISAAIFPPSGFGPPGARIQAPTLYPPALNPTAFAAAAAMAAQQWRSGLVPAIQQSIPIPTTTVFPKSDTDHVIKRELEKEPRFQPEIAAYGAPEEPTMVRSASAATPACFEDEDEDGEADEDAEDSASCSSSEATNESEMPEAAGTKEVLWRPYDL